MGLAKSEEFTVRENKIAMYAKALAHPASVVAARTRTRNLAERDIISLVSQVRLLVRLLAARGRQVRPVHATEAPPEALASARHRLWC